MLRHHLGAGIVAVMPTSYLSIVCVLAPLLPIQLPANSLGNDRNKAQVLGPMPPTGETWMNFLAPDFGLVQIQLSWPSGE